MRLSWAYKMGDGEIIKVQEEKDMGVITQDSQQSRSHVEKIFRDTYKMVRNIGTAFNYMDTNMRKIITTMIRPKMEYAETVWFPYKKTHINKLERIQRC